ncbi:pentapeptide repeat-containing protein [Vulcanococcus sp.]|uniref:pentapeptide repeat-containing protein n=2 Tax=Vulcanococcus sp. TaxID=2856995 RepID=UPI003C10D78D
MSMGQHRLRLALLALALCGSAAKAADDAAVIRTLEHRHCERCQLQDADLVHADLREAQLQGAALQRANLSGAQLDGANLKGSNLSFTSLAGASLRGADLRGSQLEGTDLRGSDLSGAQLDPGALERSHWQGARGISTAVQSYAELHNAGVRAAEAGRYPEAETFFSSAIQRLPDAAVSWVARGMSRAEQGNLALAAQDLRYASKLYAAMGDEPQAKALEQASNQLLTPSKTAKRGNGMGSALLGGALAAFKIIAPLAAKVALPGAL